MNEEREQELMRSLGRIEGRLVVLEDLTKRVSKLETWASWTKGGLAAIAFLFAYVVKGVLGIGQK